MIQKHKQIAEICNYFVSSFQNNEIIDMKSGLFKKDRYDHHIEAKYWEWLKL